MKNLKGIANFAIFAGLLAGCSLPPQPATIQRSDAVPSIVVVDGGASSVVISQAQTFQDEEGLVVSGRLKRMHDVPLPGHLDLSICAADGTLLDRQTTRVAGLTARRRGAMEIPFRFRVNAAPVAGSTIRLRYHTAASDEPCLNCKS